MWLAMIETERRRIEQMTAGWEDPTSVDWGAQGEGGESAAAAEADAAVKTPTFKCTAVYSYTVIFSHKFSYV